MLSTLYLLDVIVHSEIVNAREDTLYSHMWDL